MLMKTWSDSFFYVPEVICCVVTYDIAFYVWFSQSCVDILHISYYLVQVANTQPESGVPTWSVCTE